MEIESTPGAGTTIFVRVPVARPGNQTEPDSRKRVRVLVTDDHATVREGMKLVIGREPYMECVGEAAAVVKERKEE